MTGQTAYQELEALFQKVHHFTHLSSMAYWDSATMMPPGGSKARGQALAEVSSLINDLVGSRKTGDLIEKAETARDGLSDWQQANLREMQRQHFNASSVNSELVRAHALASSRCENAWRELRMENNWKDFEPLLSEVIDLTREQAAIRSEASGLSPYDALLNLYEPGQSSSTIDTVFARLKAYLPDFVKQTVEQQKGEVLIRPSGSFPREKQRALALDLMKAVGFDFNHGRLDSSHHPFCGGVPEDVRITTRYTEDDFSESLMGVLHETGHAKYDQGLPGAWLSQPVGQPRGMGIHESQSLFQEMQVCRSHAFLSFAGPLMAAHLSNPETPNACWEADNLYRLYNHVQPDYIRVNADEASYPLHVILRYELEKDLVNGNLKVRDIPEAWDEKMQEYLGLSTRDNYRDGCMQDIHWTHGMFGYFPTYTLGAMNAAQLYHAARKAIPNLEEQISRGDFEALNHWQSQAIWSWGSYYSIDELMLQGTGETLNPDYFIHHLQQRFSPL
ncbi:carboxypeptidase M32 [Thiolapillus brandeum]|uniref:Metal-dependent carboxypeptidase n=1 Tax=Thiolapillus brandeum TaxID=1076588 RepID=A0A7U6GK93_9GAMM|nr:carboxypeptidase M32 [Thiolapillus brandeum]BAO45212.1 carboxypeptidase Taq [Thiolapillus brandeum]